MAARDVDPTRIDRNTADQTTPVISPRNALGVAATGSLLAGSVMLPQQVAAQTIEGDIENFFEVRKRRTKRSWWEVRKGKMEILANQINGDRGSQHSFALRVLTAFSLVSALMLAMGSLAQSAEVIEIGCKYIISNAGHYKLVEDCVLDPTDARPFGVQINSADVELDLDGHIISGPGCDPNADRPIGIAEGQPTQGSSRVRVANGILKKLRSGVRVIESDHSDFNKLTLVENCVGIELIRSSENQVSYNDISRNMLQGVVVTQQLENTFANNNHITFNVIDQNGSPGKDVGQTAGGVLVIGSNPGGANSNVIAFNAISGNGQNGVVFTSGTAANIVVSNVIIQTSAAPGRDGAGVNVEGGSTDNFLVGNIALDNKLSDLADGNLNCDKNKWKDNTFRTSSPTGPNICIH
jgi:parallel beta-helix repeat protein